MDWLRDELRPETIVYKYYPFIRLCNLLATHELSFQKVSAWKTTDPFEDIFRECTLHSPDLICALHVSNFCDQLYGQSWTLQADKMHMWKEFSIIDDSLEKVSVLVKTTVSDLQSIIGYSTVINGYSFFNTRRVGKVSYLEQNEIISWIESLKNINPTEIQQYAEVAAFIKRKKRNDGYDYSREEEIRCLAWGEDEEKDLFIFKDVDTMVFSEYVLDPRLTRDQSIFVKERLMELGVDEKIIHPSHLTY